MPRTVLVGVAVVAVISTLTICLYMLVFGMPLRIVQAERPAVTFNCEAADQGMRRLGYNTHTPAESKTYCDQLLSR
jgi:hypothetical protein